MCGRYSLTRRQAELVERWGIAAGSLIMRDCSGLSRYNYVTPEAIVAVLTHIDRDERLRLSRELLTGFGLSTSSRRQLDNAPSSDSELRLRRGM